MQYEYFGFCIFNIGGNYNSTFYNNLTIIIYELLQLGHTHNYVNSYYAY